MPYLPPPNAMTPGVPSRLKDQDVSVPKDLSVVSFDDMPWSQHIDPPLTSVWQPQREMGAAEAALLVQRLQGRLDPEPRLLVLDTHLLIRLP